MSVDSPFVPAHILRYKLALNFSTYLFGPLETMSQPFLPSLSSHPKNPQATLTTPSSVKASQNTPNIINRGFQDLQNLNLFNQVFLSILQPFGTASSNFLSATTSIINSPSLREHFRDIEF